MKEGWASIPPRVCVRARGQASIGERCERRHVREGSSISMDVSELVPHIISFVEVLWSACTHKVSLWSIEDYRTAVKWGVFVEKVRVAAQRVYCRM